MRVSDCADSALLLELDADVDPVGLANAVRAAALPGTGACIPGLDSVLVEYDCLRTDRSTLMRQLEALARGTSTTPAEPGRHIVLPVCFESSVAPDLGAVAEAVGLTPDEVVAAVTGTELRVVMVGHLPGLPYMRCLPAVLDLPRRASPRARAPAGSLGVAAAMACVYPAPAPGGWHLVGRSPARLWDPAADPPALLRPGDMVRIEAVSRFALDGTPDAAAPPDRR